MYILFSVIVFICILIRESKRYNEYQPFVNKIKKDGVHTYYNIYGAKCSSYTDKKCTEYYDAESGHLIIEDIAGVNRQKVDATVIDRQKKIDAGETLVREYNCVIPSGAITYFNPGDYIYYDVGLNEEIIFQKLSLRIEGFEAIVTTNINTLKPIKLISSNKIMSENDVDILFNAIYKSNIIKYGLWNTAEDFELEEKKIVELRYYLSNFSFVTCDVVLFYDVSIVKYDNFLRGGKNERTFGK